MTRPITSILHRAEKEERLFDAFFPKILLCIDKSLAIGYYISMDTNIFNARSKNASAVNIISDSPEMESLLKAITDGFFLRRDQARAISLVCMEKAPPKVISSPCIYIGSAPSPLPGNSYFLPRPLDISALLSLLSLPEEEPADRKESPWGIIKEENCALYKGERIPLSEKETELFALLLENEGECVCRDLIESSLWGSSPASNSADVYACFLRKKLEKVAGHGVLPSIRGKGYMLKA